MVAEEIWVLAVAGCIGLCVGSFLNVVIHRLPAMISACAGDAPVTLWAPRSFCPACETSIRARDTIPVLSFLLLGGRCAACGVRISPIYPVVEILGGLAAVAAVAVYGITPAAVGASLFLWAAIALAVIDARHLLVPDALTLGLLWLGLIFAMLTDAEFATPSAAILGAAAGYLAFRAVGWAARTVLRRPALGLGDAKLFAAIGAWLGWQALAPVLLVASVAGLLTVLALRATARMSTGQAVCFAPFLLAVAAGDILSRGWVTIWVGEILVP